MSLSAQTPERVAPPPLRGGEARPGGTPVGDVIGGPVRRFYLKLLAIAFTAFSSLRIVAYLPTLWSIHASGDSDQHSLLTWVTWTGANLTMAAWLYEESGHRLTPAIAVILGNFAMCTAAVGLIVWYRL